MSNLEDFFGGSLLIKDAFSSTLTKFGEAVDSSSNKFKAFTSAIGESERANRSANQNMKSQIAQLSQDYIKQGYTMEQALRKATSEVSKEAPKSGSTWVDAFGKIKQAGTDAFGGIASKVQSFSNSTLGTITKLTGGFLSLEAAKKGLKTGFETGMEYQNLRIVMDSVYQDKNKGGQQFTMATNFASNSIWQERDVVSSLARLKALDLGDSKGRLSEMSDIGSFAKASGVGDIKSATEAYSDMMIGDWMRMTTILGVKRQQIEKFAKDNNMKAFDNKQGQITDKNALDQVFSAYIKQKGITGLSDKMANTATGKLSTLKDNVQKSLAELVGITNTGEVKDGSLFDRFTKGIGDMTTKIQQASENGNLEKLANGLTSLGNGISSAFGFLIDHPEIGSTLLGISVGIWGLGKVSSVIGTFTTIAKAFSAIGSLGMVLAPIAPYALAIAGGFALLSSALSPDGLLNQGIGWLLGELFGNDVKKGWGEDTQAMGSFFQKAKDGWMMLLHLKNPDEVFGNNDTETDPSKLQWYGGKNGTTLATDTSNIKFKTASDMVKSGDITKNSSNAYSSKTEVNFNIAKVEKTADMDEFMSEAAKRIDKHAQTRNNLDN